MSAQELLWAETTNIIWERGSVSPGQGIKATEPGVMLGVKQPTHQADSYFFFFGGVGGGGLDSLEK